MQGHGVGVLTEPAGPFGMFAVGGFVETVEAAKHAEGLHGDEVGMVGWDIADVDGGSAVMMEEFLELGDVDFLKVGGFGF